MLKILYESEKKNPAKVTVVFKHNFIKFGLFPGEQQSALAFPRKELSAMFIECCLHPFNAQGFQGNSTRTRAPQASNYRTAIDDKRFHQNREP